MIQLTEDAIDSIEILGNPWLIHVAVQLNRVRTVDQIILQHIEQVLLTDVLQWQEKTTEHHRVDKKGDKELHE